MKLDRPSIVVRGVLTALVQDRDGLWYVPGQAKPLRWIVPPPYPRRGVAR